MNTSLLVSESVFIQVTEEDVGKHLFNTANKDQDLNSLTWTQLIKTDMQQTSQSCNEENKRRVTPDSSVCSEGAFKSVSVSDSFDQGPIQMTQAQAMRLLNLAASLLQANIKRYFQQKRYKQILKEYKAAVKIQAAWRGYRTRHLDINLIHKKHDYTVKKLHQVILGTDKKYQQKIDKLKKDQRNLVTVISRLLEEVEEIKNVTNVAVINETNQELNTNLHDFSFTEHITLNENNAVDFDLLTFDITSPTTNTENIIKSQETFEDITDNSTKVEASNEHADKIAYSTEMMNIMFVADTDSIGINTPALTLMGAAVMDSNENLDNTDNTGQASDDAAPGVANLESIELTVEDHVGIVEKASLVIQEETLVPVVIVDRNTTLLDTIKPEGEENLVSD